jgi:general nucleoside transport system permease protein
MSDTEIVSTKAAPPKKKSFFRKPWVVSVGSSLISILMGLLVGFLVLVCINPAAAPSGFINMLKFGFTDQNSVANIFYSCAPILMTGLAVAFAFKAGSFNIGGAGQYMGGATFAFVGAVLWHLPWPVCLLLALLGGAVVGCIPGVLKAFFNVNEVLSAIMLNWIVQAIFYMVCQSNTSLFVSNGTTVKVSNVSPISVLPTWGMEVIDPNFTIGFVLACILAIIIWTVLEKTTLGFEIKACGLNKDAAKYAGINEKKNIILAFTISGALAGIGGALYILMPAAANSGLDVKYSGIPSQGFDGISVALLANNNPIGCIFSALFIQYLTYSGTGLGSAFTHKIPSLIVGVIVYFASFVAFVRVLLQRCGTDKPFWQKWFKKKPAPSPEVAAPKEAPTATEKEASGK